MSEDYVIVPPGFLIWLFKGRAIKKYKDTIFEGLKSLFDADNNSIMTESQLVDIVQSANRKYRLPYSVTEWIYADVIEYAFDVWNENGYSDEIDIVLNKLDDLTQKNIDILLTKKRNAFEEYVEEKLENKYLSKEEMEAITAYGKTLRLSVEQIKEFLENYESMILAAHIAYEIKRGILPESQCGSIVLQSKEICHLVINEVSLFEERNVRGESRLKEIDSGELIITNQRIVFNGGTRSIVSLVKNIVNISEHSGGITIGVSNRQKNQYYEYDETLSEIVPQLIYKIMDRHESNV